MQNNDTTTIVLDTPIARGEDTILTVIVRKPKSGELRGTQLVNLLHMDVSSLETVLPRITTPTLTKQDVNSMDPADLTQFGMAVSSFLLTKANKDSFQQA